MLKRTVLSITITSWRPIAEAKTYNDYTKAGQDGTVLSSATVHHTTERLIPFSTAAYNAVVQWSHCPSPQPPTAQQ